MCVTLPDSPSCLGSGLWLKGEYIGHLWLMVLHSGEPGASRWCSILFHTWSQLVQRTQWENLLEFPFQRPGCQVLPDRGWGGFSKFCLRTVGSCPSGGDRWESLGTRITAPAATAARLLVLFSWFPPASAADPGQALKPPCSTISLWKDKDNDDLTTTMMVVAHRSWGCCHV